MEINIENVTKKYHNKLALDNISLQFKEPKIYALLGRNGSGKTTLMNIIAGHYLPTSGRVLFDGEAGFDNRQVLQDICLIKESDNFHPDMKVKDVLATYQRVYPNWHETLANELLKVYKLPLKVRVKTLSKGMVSALSVIVGLASGAKITIFDEPYIGMDAAAREKFYDVLLEVYEEEARTIIFSTHLIDEASLLFQEVFILKNGQLILQEDAEILRVKTYSITGEKTIVEDFIRDKYVMKTKELANMMTAFIYGDKQDIPSELQVDGVPIQEVMIYLTEQEDA